MTAETVSATALADAQLLVDSLVAPQGIHAVFQPVVRLADGVVIGYEALARSAAMPTISPATWLAAAEVAGRRQEVELVCVAAALEAGPPPNRALLFVNVSPDVALHPELPELCRALPRHVLEVTEHAAIDDYEPLQEGLRELRSQGSLVAVDDVGAGYASMSHVLQLSPSFIKIDRSLVHGLDTDPRRRALVEALQAFASAMGALSIAEGVETEAELAELRRIEVDLAQGFLLARPQAPWAGLNPRARRILDPRRTSLHPTDLAELSTALDASATPAEASDVVCRFLALRGGLLPSVYLASGGALRCMSRRGQWLVLDGLQPGVGITGAAYHDEAEIVVPDVRADPRYLVAVPGVYAEMAVPLRVDDEVVGVLNVDALAPLLPAHCDLIRGCAAVLQVRLVTMAESGMRDPAVRDLGRLAPVIAQADSPSEVCEAALAGVAELTGFDSGCLWTYDADDAAALVVRATFGPASGVLVALSQAEVSELRDLVAGLTACFSGGADASLAVEPTWVLRRRGARGVVLVPIRDGRNLAGLLAVTSGTSSYVPAEAVDAVGSLCLLAGARLAALGSSVVEVAALDLPTQGSRL